MRTLIMGLALLSASSVSAGQSDTIALQAAECWDLPVGTEGLTKAQFEVTFDSDGFVSDATVLGHKSEKASTRVFVLSALRALQKCAPFKGVSGTHSVMMDIQNLPAARGGINPFK